MTEQEYQRKIAQLEAELKLANVKYDYLKTVCQSLRQSINDLAKIANNAVSEA